MAIAYAKKDDYDRAVERLQYQAIELNPNSAIAYNSRGIAYREKGDFDRAIEDYNKAIELTPDYAEAIYQSWGCLRQQRRL